LDLPIVLGKLLAASGTIGDMGGAGDDRAEDVSLSLPFILSEGGREADGPDASEESSSAMTDFFIRLNSEAEPDPIGIPGLDETSDRSSNSLTLGFFFLAVPPRAIRSVS
jgi:hypothetical protein